MKLIELLVEKQFLKEEDVTLLMIRLFSAENEISPGVSKIVCAQLKTKIQDDNEQEFLDSLVSLILKLTTKKEKSLELIVKHFSLEIPVFKDVKALFSYMKFLFSRSNLDSPKEKSLKGSVVVNILDFYLKNELNMPDKTPFSVFTYRLVSDSEDIINLLREIEIGFIPVYLKLFDNFLVEEGMIIRFDHLGVVGLVKYLKGLYFSQINEDYKIGSLISKAIFKVVENPRLIEVLPNFNIFSEEFKQEISEEFYSSFDLRDPNSLFKLADLSNYLYLFNGVSALEVLTRAEEVIYIDLAEEKANLEAVRVAGVMLLRWIDRACAEPNSVGKTQRIRDNCLEILLGILEKTKGDQFHVRQLKNETVEQLLNCHLVLSSSNLQAELRVEPDERLISNLSDYLKTYFNYFVKLNCLANGQKLPFGNEYATQEINTRIEEYGRICLSFSRLFLVNIGFFRDTRLSLLYFELFGSVELPPKAKNGFEVLMFETLLKEVENYSKLSEEERLDSTVICILYVTRISMEGFNGGGLNSERFVEGGLQLYSHYLKALRRLKPKFGEAVFKDKDFIINFIMNSVRLGFEEINGKLENLEILDLVGGILKKRFFFFEADYKRILTFLVRMEKKTAEFEANSREKIEKLRAILVKKSNLVTIKEENEDENKEINQEEIKISQEALRKESQPAGEESHRIRESSPIHRRIKD